MIIILGPWDLSDVPPEEARVGEFTGMEQSVVVNYRDNNN